MTVAANCTIIERLPASLRGRVTGGLALSGAAARVAAQTLIAAFAPALGGIARAVGALSFANAFVIAIFLVIGARAVNETRRSRVWSG